MSDSTRPEADSHACEHDSPEGRGLAGASPSELQVLIDAIPISIWVEDFSRVKHIRDRLADAGVSDFRAHLGAHPELVLSCLDAIEVTAVNQESLRLHGAPHREALLAGLRRTFTQRSLETFTEELIDLIEGRAPRALEAEIQTLGGEPRQVLISVSVNRNRLDWSQIFVTLADITKQKLVEEELRLQKAFLAETERVSHIGGWTLDARTRKMDWTEEVFRIFGFEATQRPDLERALACYPESARIRLSEALEQCLDLGRSYELDLPFVDTRGRSRWTRSIGHAEWRDGRVVRAAGTLQDITGLRRSEERRRKLEADILHNQKLKSLGVLAGGIAHDFNNILGAVIGQADLALADSSPGLDLRPQLLEIKSSAQRAARLAGQMLAYSGRGTFRQEAIDLDSFWLELASLLRITISKKTQLVVHAPPKLAPILFDPEQLEQVLMNLVMNASEALDDERGQVDLCTSCVERSAQALAELEQAFPLGHESPLAGGPYLQFEVRDTGTGIAPEDVPQVFDPFFTTKFTGRGLGMAAVAGILRSHGGAAEIQSTLGRGTVFRVLLPLRLAPDGLVPAPRASQAVPRQSPPVGSAGHVLVADDEAPLRKILSSMLERLGFEVTLAPDGTQALALFEDPASAFDLAIFDITMPGLDGLDLFDRVRAADPNLPVILSSGYSETGLASRFGDRRPAAFLQKPFVLADVQAAVARAIGPDGA